MPAKASLRSLSLASQLLHKPAPTQASAYSDGVIFVRMSNAPLLRRVFFRIRFTPYEGSHLEIYP